MSLLAEPLAIEDPQLRPNPFETLQRVTEMMGSPGPATCQRVVEHAQDMGWSLSELTLGNGHRLITDEGGTPWYRVRILDPSDNRSTVDLQPLASPCLNRFIANFVHVWDDVLSAPQPTLNVLEPRQGEYGRTLRQITLPTGIFV